MKRLIILSALLSLIALSVGAQPLDTLRLEMAEAVRIALEASPEVEIERSQQEFAEARSRFAAANRYFSTFRLTTLHTFAPGLSIPNPDVPLGQLYLDPGVRNDWTDLRPFNRFELEVVQPIFTWGELGGSIRAARHAVDVERAGVRGKESEVALRTAEIYQGLLLASSLQRLTSEAENVIEIARRELQRLLDEGSPDVDDADMFKLQITEQEFLSQVAEVNEQLQTAQTALRRQMMLPDGTLVLPVDASLSPIPIALDTLDQLLQLAAVHRPEIAMAEAGAQARSALLEVARSNYYPKVFIAGTTVLGVAAGRHRQPNPFVGDAFRSRTAGAAIGLRMNLNVAQTRAEVEQARAELNEVKFQQEAAVQLIAFEVEEAYRRVSISTARMDTRRRSLDIAREWLRTEQINFDLGFGSAQNLIDAVQTTMQLEAGYLESVHGYNSAVLKLLDSAGILVNRVQSEVGFSQ